MRRSCLSLLFVFATLPVSGQCLTLTTIFPPTLESNSGFGNTVAIGSDFAVVGARGETHSGIRSGAAHVYRRESGAWLHDQVLLPDDPDELQWFGDSVDLEGDRIVVGAPWDSSSALRGGAVYVFERVGSEWLQTAKIVSPRVQINMELGCSVSLREDRLVAGAPGIPVWDLGGGSVATWGTAEVYEIEGGSWELQQELWSDGVIAGSDFGSAVDQDADRIVVGAPGDFANGATHVFRLIGDTWTFEERLVSTLPGAGENQGTDVAISGEWIAAGTYTSGIHSHPHVVQIFKRVDGAWIDGQVIESPAGLASSFGRAVALDGALDGATLAVGQSNPSACHLYRLVADQFRRVGSVSGPLTFAQSSCDVSSGFVIAGALYTEVLGVSSAGSVLIAPINEFSDCDGDGLSDACEIQSGFAQDLDGDGVPDECQLLFIRGDCNADAQVDIGDVVAALNHLFAGIGSSCVDACDFSDDGLFTIGDAILLVSTLFGVGGDLSLGCVTDPSEDLHFCLSSGCP